MIDPLARLEARISDTDDVYIGADVDAAAYLAGLEESLRAAICTPFSVSATVDPPGFLDVEVGQPISGMCVAHADGYWLVYQAEANRFLCFWGTDAGNLGAPGISGTPLGCWSA